MAAKNSVNASEIAWHMRCHAQEQHHEWITPNVFLYAWESDLVTVSPLGLVHEIEVKCSRSDLKNDLKKPKHKRGHLLKGITPHALGARKQRTKATAHPGPNYFSFAMPCAVFRKPGRPDIPGFAGIYTVDEQGRVQEERPPTLLHPERISTRQLFLLARRIHHRYWDHLRRSMHAPDTLQLELAG